MAKREKTSADAAPVRTGIKIGGNAYGSMRDVTVKDYERGMDVGKDLNATMDNVTFEAPTPLAPMHQPWYQRPIGILIIGVPLAFFGWGATVIGPWVLKALGLSI